MSTLYERCAKVMPPVGNRVTTLGITKAEGCYIYDENNRKILDFSSGIAVCNLGHNHPAVVEAAKKQMDEMVHVCHNLVYYPPYAELAEKLVELTGGDTKVYFSNSGAEANEGAMKLAKYATGRPAIISFKGSFHGRTLACATITCSNSAYRKHYEPLMPSVYYAEYPNLYRTPYKYDDGKLPIEYKTQFDEMFKKIIDPYSVAAIIMEPVQGEGGYVVPPKEFVQFMRRLCDQYGICLIFDEIQTGFGRTGKMFAYENFGVRPDIMTCAKAIANGFPLSAVIGRAEIMDKWAAGAHGGTFGGNPVSCAAALATIHELEGGVLAHGAEMGQYFMTKLEVLQKKYSFIGDLRGLGLMIGMEIVHPEDKTPDTEITKKITAMALEKGLFILSCGCDKNVVRFIAPLIIEKEQIDTAVSILDACMSEV